MTVGKFITGTFKFMANFMVLIIVGMSSFYLWNELQPLPQADNLVIAPAGTNFLRDPEGFLRGEGYDYADFSKLMKGDYFATVATDAQNKAVLIHQLSKHATQSPFWHI